MSSYWLRIDPPELGNIYFNNKNSATPGISTCINGKDNNNHGRSVYGRNVMPNCVGMAAGCFNETFVKNMRLLRIQLFPDGWYYNFNCNGRSFIDRAEDINKEIRSKGHNKPLLGVYRFSEYPNLTPPEGSMMVYANGANHVTFVVKVIAEGHVKIIQSGYGGWNGAWDTKGYDKCKRSNGWRDGSSSDTNKCIGFITNPALHPVAGDPYWEKIATSKTAVSNIPSSTVPITSFSIPTSNIEVMEETSTTVSITCRPAETTQVNFTVTSSNTSVATVSHSNGLITVTATGSQGDTATITVKNVDLNRSETFSVTVTNSVTDILTTVSIPHAPIIMTAGDTYDFDCVGYAPNGVPTNTNSYTVTWSASSADGRNVLQVDSSTGVAKALRGGTTTLTATAVGEDNLGNSVTKSASVSVVVAPRKGVYAGGHFCTPYVFINGTGWRKLIPKVRRNNSWKDSIEKV